MVEVFGDSSRDGELALVRLAVDGDRIVSADADGLARPLDGLTLMEAAAVPGETLAADALANALAEHFTAAPDPGRIAVAMSGGVDSAVALLRAGPDAVGVTLRLWLDPAGPDSERACCSPEAVIAARETCHALGLPHVTLDLREAFRRAVVDPFVASYARGETPNPCGRCNGDFRFDELLAFVERAGAAKLWTGHYARIVERGGRRLTIRPEKVRILDEAESANELRVEEGRIRDVSYVGMVTRFVVELDEGGELQVVRQNLEMSSQEALEQRGRRVRVGWHGEHAYAISDSQEQTQEEGPK